MKKVFSALMAILMVWMMLAAGTKTACAASDTLSTILNEYPGYQYDKNTKSLSTKSYNFAECIPELNANGCYLYVSVSNNNAAPTFLLIISAGERLHDFSVVRIMTDTTDYTITTDSTKSTYMKTLNMMCSPNGKTPELIQNMLDSEAVSIRLESSGECEDLYFSMNEPQRRLLELSYAYYTDALKNANQSNLFQRELFLESVMNYVVTQEPHQEAAGVHNGNGGMFPWCVAYVGERYPEAKPGKDGVHGYLQVIIDEEGLATSSEMLCLMLAGAESEEQFGMILDEIIKLGTVSSTGFSAIDEIREYKQLLDEGIITQEEFDAKKKQLLDL